MRIDTQQLILRPVLPTDAEDIFEYASSPEVGPKAGWKPHASLEETQTLMKQIFVGVDGVFGILRREDSKLIGTIGLIPDMKREYDRARMLGYSIGRAYWGRGYTTEVAQALIRYGFQVKDLAVISAYCYPGNNRSRRVIEKCGFLYEGCHREAEERFDGMVLAHDCYSLLRADWMKIQTKGE